MKFASLFLFIISASSEIEKLTSSLYSPLNSRLDMEEVYRVPKWVAGAVLGLPQGERYTGMAFGGGGGSKIGPEPGDISEMSDSEPEQPEGDEVDSSGVDYDCDEKPSKVELIPT